MRSTARLAPPFRPSPLLSGFHRQTLAAQWHRPPALPVAEDMLVRVDEGTRVLVRLAWQRERERAPTAVLLHGLGGDGDRPYMRSTAAKAFAAGFHVARLNLRNCGGTEHLTDTLYHAGLTDDLAAVVGVLRGHERVASLYLAGFSMGGAIVLRLLGQWGDLGPPAVRGAVVISAPLELAACAGAIDGQLALWPYRRSYLGALKGLLRRRAQLEPGRWDLAGLAQVRTLYEFDDRWTGPSFGFGNAATYYREASAGSVLGRIRVPTLAIHARDDRLVPADCWGGLRDGETGAVRRLLVDRGGHLGFLAGRPAPGDPDRRWAENRLVSQLLSLESDGGVQGSLPGPRVPLPTTGP